MRHLVTLSVVLLGCGDHAPSPTAPPSINARLACTCALHTARSEPGSSGKCTLSVHPDGTAALSGELDDAQGRSIDLLGDWTVVPIPPDRVEPEPFTAFRGALTLTGGDLGSRKDVDVVFIDNLMYEIALPDSGDPAQSIALICNPP